MQLDPPPIATLWLKNKFKLDSFDILLLHIRIIYWKKKFIKNW